MQLGTAGGGPGWRRPWAAHGACDCWLLAGPVVESSRAHIEACCSCCAAVWYAGSCDKRGDVSSQALVAGAGCWHKDSNCTEQFTTSQQLSLLPQIPTVLLIRHFAAPTPVLCVLRALLGANMPQVYITKSVPFAWAVVLYGSVCAQLAVPA
eukprot:SAG25_NODE_5830_length_616_cov_18.208897_1_plen_151_part_01